MKKILIIIVLINICFYSHSQINDYISYWSFDGNANDVNTNNGIEYNGVSYFAGKVNQAASFDGVDDFIQVTNNSNLNFGTGDFTVSLWFKSNILNTRHDLITKKNLNQKPNNNDFAIFLNTDNKIYFYIKESTSYIISSVESVTTEWIHVVALRRNDNIELYINNTLSSTGICNFNISSDGPIRIGSNRYDPSDESGSPTSPFNGAIDEVYFFSKALSVDDVSELYLGESNMESVWKQTGSDIYFETGNVAIGTTTIPNGFNFAVNGKIVTKEVKVTLDGWSDFVFNKDYDLKDLEEVENFIEENNHLPDVPSEKDVIENGIALGEMDATLLQKIEELTLYMIEQNKKTNKLIEEVQDLKVENKTLKKEINTLKTL